MTTTRPKVTFETEPCSRCGGSGEYSFNLMHGTTCFKCNGGRLQLSRRGRVARKAYDAVMADMTRTYGDVVTGDRVKLAFGAGAAKWRTATVVESTAAHRVELLCGTIGFNANASDHIMVWSADVYERACRRVAKLAGATVTGLAPIEPTAVEAAIAGTGSLALAAQVQSVDDELFSIVQPATAPRVTPLAAPMATLMKAAPKTAVTPDELIKLIDTAPTTYEVLTAPKTAAPGRRSHADCEHERTPKARAKCRATRS